MANLLNLVKMTVSELRELARKYLGRGHSRLKTKNELIAALKQKVSDSRAKAVPAKTKSPPKTKPMRRKEAAPRRSKPAPTARAARVSSGSPPVPDIGALGAPPKASTPPKVLNEGFFVGAQVPTAIARPRSPIHLAPALPEGYGSDEVVAIYRGPGTLFVFWDFGEETILAAAQGLVDWRLVLRVYRGAEIVREVAVELVQGRAYLEDLPNDSARVELHAVGTNAPGRLARSRLGALSGGVLLCPRADEGMSPSFCTLTCPSSATRTSRIFWRKTGSTRRSSRRIYRCSGCSNGSRRIASPFA